MTFERVVFVRPARLIVAVAWCRKSRRALATRA